MTKTYRVGIACLSHDHIWGELNRWREQPNAEIVAAGDDEPRLLTRLQKEQEAKGPVRVYDSWQALLEKEDLDIVQIAGGNSESADIVDVAAAKGCHIIVEKPMAATLAQADRMLKAAQTAGVHLLVNWPTAWVAAWQELERRALAGDIGSIRYVRYRSAHSGPIAIGCDASFVRDLIDPAINGAGAFMDYCGYGADLAVRLLGLPQSVTAMRGVFGDEPAYRASDDNAILTAQYPHAFVLCEASWTQPVGFSGPNPLLFGSGGALGVLHDKVIWQRPGQPDEILTPPATQAPYRSGPEYLLYCLESGTAVEGFCSARVSRDAQEILEAGLRAADTGRTQTLPLVA